MTDLTAHTQDRFTTLKSYAESIILDEKSNQLKLKEQGKPYWKVEGTQIFSNAFIMMVEKEENGQRFKDIWLYSLSKLNGGCSHRKTSVFNLPFLVVCIAKRWSEWFLRQNAYLDGSEASQNALKWLGSCNERVSRNNDSYRLQKYIKSQLKIGKKFQAPCKVLDNQLVSIIGESGSKALIMLENKTLKSCCWTYLDLSSIENKEHQKRHYVRKN
jgi:hypothetical protein